MYAVVEAGGRQWKLEPGSQLEINRIVAEVGSPHTIERVLLAHDAGAVQVGRPYVAGAKVVCEVLAHPLGQKTISYHFRRRENWRKTRGHRQPLTRLLVKDILVGNTSALAATEAASLRASRPVLRIDDPAGLEIGPEAKARVAPKAAASHAAKPKAAPARASQRPSVKKEKGHGA